MTVTRRRIARPLLATAVLSSAFTAAVSAPPPEGPAITQAGQAAALTAQPEDDWYRGAIKGRGIAGAATCRRCHEGGGSDSEVGARLGLGPGADDWTLGNELKTWITCDRHFHAYKVLLPPSRRTASEGTTEAKPGQRVQEMAERLGAVDPKTGESLLHLDPRCLACHSAYPVDYFKPMLTSVALPNGRSLDVLPQDKLDGELRSVAQVLNLGVSCEGCHGPSTGNGKDPGWGTAHFSTASGPDSKAWRHLSVSEKLDGHGYWPVGSWSEQTRICLSCHLGNVAQGKVVTHEMYAAGHPPLPGFELVTFGLQAPQHWRDLGEKSDEVRKDYIAKLGDEAPNGGYQPDDLRRSRKLLVAAAAATAGSLRFAGDLAGQGVGCPAPVPKPDWPELTAFACYSCHHELAVPSWRQTRILEGAPQPRAGLGRPRLHEWPEALVGIAVEVRDGSTSNADIPAAGVYDLLKARPFGGRPEDFATAAHQAAARFDQLADDLEASKLTVEQGRQVLAKIAEEARSGAADYDSARQLAWAFSVIYREMTLPPGGSFDESFWYQTVKDDPVAKVLVDLHGPLRLDLLGNVGERCETPREPSDRELKEPLDRIADYDPELIRQAFETLAELVPKQDRRSAAR